MPLSHGFRGRGDRIRTCDILLPKQARYRTAPLPDDGGFGHLRCGRQELLINALLSVRSFWRYRTIVQLKAWVDFASSALVSGKGGGPGRT